MSTIISIHDSFLEGAETDLKAAKATLKDGLFSETLYIIEQSLEKSTKSLYAYYLFDYDHFSDKKIYTIIPYSLMIAKLYKVRTDFNLAVYNFGSCR
jgi:hypothetical protein